MRKITILIVIIVILGSIYWLLPKIKKDGSDFSYDGNYKSETGYIKITKESGGYGINGQSSWTKDQTTNTGEISGKIIITDGKAQYIQGQCEMDLIFQGKKLTVRETENSICGGLNVTFSGSYTKQ